MSYIEMVHNYKSYQTGETEILANKNVNFKVEKGELAIVLGPSGAGKSTVLNILGGMDKNTKGQVIIDGNNIADYTAKQLTEYRRESVGFVFQFYNLVPNLTAKENVELASEIVEEATDPEQVLEEVGLKNRMNNFPAQLSGGEQQRVAIARALAKNPQVILCDEPTGALDFETGKMILSLLVKSSREYGKTVIIVTHNSAIAQLADRIIHVADARIKSNVINEHVENPENIVW